MRCLPLTICFALLAGSSAPAAPATQPALVPVPTPQATAAPATQPVKTRTPTILVLPFYEAAGTNLSWIGKAIQQDLVADLSRATRSRVDAPSSAPPAADAAVALQAARSASAVRVVYGQYQTIGTQMRMTGQVLDVATGQSVGSISVTGPTSDLFPLEDQVAGQVLRSLPPNWLTVPLPPIISNPYDTTGTDAYAAERTIPPVAPQPAAPPVGAQQYYSYTYPDYSTNTTVSPYDYYGYPYYWYGVPYYGPDLFFYYGWDHFHHDHWRHWGNDAEHWHPYYHEVPHTFSHVPQGRPSGGFSHGGGGFGGGSHGGGGFGGGGHR